MTEWRPTKWDRVQMVTSILAEMAALTLFMFTLVNGSDWYKTVIAVIVFAGLRYSNDRTVAKWTVARHEDRRRNR
jgi:hypothetical protein